MTKIKNFCRDCGEPMEKPIDICMNCRVERVKEREAERDRYYKVVR